MRTRLLNATCLSAIVVTAAWATPTLAQDSGGIGEIIVTAQRKEETLQDAAIAIDAVGGNDLIARGITQADNLTKAVPAISITNGGGSNTSIFIRGVGNITTSSYNDPAVTPSYDGVVLGRAAGAFGAAFYDLARVEVLKGPQGILYGRNATGGAVNIIPNAPVLGESSGGFTVSAGNYDAVNAEGHLNLTIGDNSALRVAATRQVHDGYNRDGSDDLDRSGLRAQFLFEPSDTLRIKLGADYTKVDGVGAGPSYIGTFIPGETFTFVPSGLDSSEGMYTDAANAFRNTSLGAPGFGFLDSMNQQQSNDATYWGVNAQIDLDTSIGTLTVIPAYRKTKAESYFYGPAFNTAYTNERDNQFSLETRLAGSVGMVDYVVGGFYFDEKVQNTGEYNQEFVLPIQHYTHKTTSYAGFGQLTFNVSDSFRVVGGLRYTHDKKSIDGVINNFITFCGGIPPVTPPASFAAGCAAPGALPHYPNFTSTSDTIGWLVDNAWIPATSTLTSGNQVFPLLSGAGLILKTDFPVQDSGSFSKLTWKAGVEYDVTPDSLLYATAESGYRAGGFQLSEGNPTYNPETITAFTIGSKNRFLNNKVQLNIEGFLWKYKDQQIGYFTVSDDGVLVNTINNAGRADIKGFDVDLTVKPFFLTTLNAKVQYLDSKYKEFTRITAPPRHNINCPSTLTGQTLSDGTPIISFDCSGKPLLFSPKWAINLGAEQILPVNDTMELVASVNTAWRASSYGAFEYLDFEKIKAYWTTDADLTLRLTDGGLSLGAFVRNIENKRRIASPQSSPIGFAVATYTAPRTYGVRLSAEF
ncbi:iron complex outermembrane recepter protein [Novosphingobium sp. CF614]|uniref:TonB-dependent receptor n=1 Tax=Novosphingobium sp. CF614 TaxID=1884364 RepID=UPI0008F1C048|nr:TonB-dependent receptor [Novosphingobium sp. CF614]SFG42930.1 iron complex outermembrane recepter protein [Novosphingobium sp. CF614]